MPDLEIEETIREAEAIVQAGGSPSARRLAAALLAVTGGTSTHPHWITPEDLWRDRLAVLANQGAWLAAWGPRPGEPACQVLPCPTAGKPNTARELLPPVALNRADKHCYRQRN